MIKNIDLKHKIRSIKYLYLFSLVLLSLITSVFINPKSVKAATTTPGIHSSVCNSDKYAFKSIHNYYYFFCYTATYPNQLSIDVVSATQNFSLNLSIAKENDVFPQVVGARGGGGARINPDIYASSQCSIGNNTYKVIVDLLKDSSGCSSSKQVIYLSNYPSNATNVGPLMFGFTAPDQSSYTIDTDTLQLTPANGTQFWSSTPNFASVNILGGISVGGNYPWYDSKGDKQNADTMTGRLQFVSPLKIYDKVTKEYYITAGDNSFFDYATGSPRDFIDDGDSVYYPSGGIQGDNKCYGVINVVTNSENPYPQVNLIPTTYSSGSQDCFIAYGSADFLSLNKVSDYITKNSAGQTVGLHYRGKNDFLRNDSSNTLKLSSINKQMFYSMFQWIDQNTIQLYGNTSQLFRLSGTTSPTLQQALTNLNMPSSSKVAIFTNKTCGVLNNAFPLVLVNYSSGNIDTDYGQQNNSNVKGLFYYPQGSQTSQGWNSTKLQCLFGFDSSKLQNITSTDTYGSINQANSDLTYISEPQQSLSGTPVGITTSTTPPSDTPVDQTPTCETNVSPLTWIICPIFEGAKNFSEWIFSILSSHLKVLPVNTVADPKSGKYDSLYVVWQSFRDFGDVILVIAVIIIVYSEAVGGSIADAYNVRKMLPRILIAAILINLSIYAVNTLVDIFNILGVGISDLILRPFQSTDIFRFTPTGGQQLGAFGFGMLGAFVGVGGVTAAVYASVGAVGALSGILGGIFSYVFLLALPLLVGALAIWITVMVRWGLIVLLTLFSPIAFALYALPNTETYFKKWWKLLIQALMVYPVVMVMVAIGSILSAITYKQGSVSGGITGFVLQFLPLIATPFAFKISGGILGTISDYLTKNGMKWTSRITKGARERKKEELGVKMNQSKKTLYDKLDNPASQTNNRFKRTAARFARNRLGGRRMLEENSRINAAQAKRIEEANATGSDTLSFADTVDKASADADFNAGYSEYSDVKTRQVYRISRNGLKRVNTTTGRVEYTDIRRGNNWHSSAVVDQASAMFRGNNAAHTANLRYVLNKSNTDEELTNAKNGMGTLIRSWGATTTADFTSVLKGATIPLQETKLELKFLKFDDHGVPTLDTNGVVNELFEKRNSYNMGNLSASTVKNLSDSYATMPLDQQVKIKKILETFVQKGGPELDTNTGAPTGRMRPDGVSIPGPANTQEKWREFAKQVYSGTINPFA